tara:strand:+ start:213 stop:800 length:588 start_codon:yes stop_codon:yes gene_type:complete
MQYLLTPYSESIEPWVWWEKAFSEEELSWLQEKAAEATDTAQAGGYSQGEELAKIRRSTLSWLHNEPETQWVYERLAHVVASLNSQFYRFDLSGFGEAIQLTNYSEEQKGMYGWHQDFGGSRVVSRKLSLVLQLTDPAEYEGGNLQILTNGEPQNLRKERGMIIAFPSYTLHQVTPVTSGNRQSLVTWVSGPAFK